MYETIKKFLEEGGRCLLIENGKPIGIVLTMEEYEKLQRPTKNEVETPKIKVELPKSEPVITNPVGAAMVEEMGFPTASANIDEINLADSDNITLEDLGLDELPY